MAQTYNNISDEAVQNATGRSWDEWLALLDAAGAADMTHKEIAAMIMDNGYIAAGGEWWAQTVTVGYEYARGRRVKGETVDVGFQVGVQKTLPVDAAALWEFLTSPAGLPLWLGNGVDGLAFEPGETYRTREGTTGEIRTVYPAERLRLTWQPAGWDNESTLQLYLDDKALRGKGEKTALRFHHEKLTGPDQRSQMKTHWREVLNQISKAKM